MEIVQKKGSTTHTFTFHDEHFNFAYQDKSGSDETEFNYAEFPSKNSIQIEHNEWLRNVGILWCIIGLIQFGHAIYSQASLAGKGAWLLLGLICIAWAYRTTIKYSVFKMERGSVFVMQGKHHDKIVEELSTRRKNQLRGWHGEIDIDNDPEQEIRKFRWLAEQTVLSAEEADEKIAQLELIQQDAGNSQSKRLN